MKTTAGTRPVLLCIGRYLGRYLPIHADRKASFSEKYFKGSNPFCRNICRNTRRPCSTPTFNSLQDQSLSTTRQTLESRHHLTARSWIPKGLRSPAPTSKTKDRRTNRQRIPTLTRCDDGQETSTRWVALLLATPCKRTKPRIAHTTQQTLFCGMGRYSGS